VFCLLYLKSQWQVLLFHDVNKLWSPWAHRLARWHDNIWQITIFVSRDALLSLKIPAFSSVCLRYTSNSGTCGVIVLSEYFEQASRLHCCKKDLKNHKPYCKPITTELKNSGSSTKCYYAHSQFCQEEMPWKVLVSPLVSSELTTFELVSLND
jgi:hypothetical protein